MAYYLRKSSTFIALMCLTLLFSNEHIAEGDDDLCESNSSFWEGLCQSKFQESDCDHLCANVEGAISGHCSGAGNMCICMRKCSESHVCLGPSGRFGGPCFDRQACHNLCTGGEGAVGGNCRDFMCMCLHKC